MLLNDSDEKDRWFRFDDVFVCMRWRLKDGYKKIKCSCHRKN